MGNSDMLKFFNDMEADSKNLRNELLKICWFMRGGVSYQEALNMGPEDRMIVGNIIKENMDTTKKTGQPFF
jgi:hypothetical protein